MFFDYKFDFKELIIVRFNAMLLQEALVEEVEIAKLVVLIESHANSKLVVLIESHPNILQTEKQISEIENIFENSNFCPDGQSIFMRLWVQT